MRMILALSMWLPTVASMDVLNARDYYVSPAGRDSNDGRSPFAPVRTLRHAASLIEAGDTLMLRGGIYTDDAFVSIVPGNSNKPVTIRGYPGDGPVFVGSYDPGFKALLYITRPHYRIENLVVQLWTAAGSLVEAHSTHHLTIKNVTASLAGCSLITAVRMTHVLIAENWVVHQGEVAHRVGEFSDSSFGLPNVSEHKIKSDALFWRSVPPALRK
mgnify:CR=1 FL=1